MINAEVTAENKPACTPHQYASIEVQWRTDEDQGGVQILVVLLQEFLVVFFGNLAIFLVELSLMIFLGRWCLLFLLWAIRGSQRQFCWVWR